MDNFELKINSRIEVILKDGDYKCNVQDLSEDYIAISVPMSTGQYIPLPNGTIIDVIYYEEENLYKFKSSIIGRKFENIPILIISKPVEITKIQRRKYVRVPLMNTAKYKNLKNMPNTKPSSIGESEYLKAILVDLSGGGMKVRVSEEIKMDDFILVDLTVNNENMFLVGQAKRIVKDDEGRFLCGLSFEFLDNSTQERIISYIFKLMREQMRKI